jgi:uncharacterized phage-associated protein
MPSNIYREKLLQAILFFAQKTKHANMTKMSKLLYFFDFKHFKETGYPAIGLEYFAFERGPVPQKLWLELRDGNVPEDFKDKLALIINKNDYNKEWKEIEFKAKSKPDLSIFSPREQRILDDLVLMFKDVKAYEISEISHLPNEPWSITKASKGPNKPIDYMLAIDKEAPISCAEAEDSLREHLEVVKNFEIEPVK